MSAPVWPATLRQTPRRGNWSGGMVDERVSFRPDRGPPIERAGVTAAYQIWNATFPNLNPAQLAEWERFVGEDLRNGLVSFVWTDPVTGQPALWRLMRRGDLLYELSSRGASLVDLTVQLMRMPDFWLTTP